MNPIMPMQKQFKLKDDILLYRLNYLLPKLMKETNIDMWIVIGDEYNEGPCLKTLLPSTFFHARKKSLFIFTYDGEKTEKLIVSKPDFTISNFYTPVLLKPSSFDFETFYSTFARNYDLEEIRKMPVEDTYECVNRIIKERNPKNIAIQTSDITSFSDGLSHTNYIKLIECLEEDYRKRIVSGENLTIRWLETRTEMEIDLMKQIIEKTREIIKLCYSREVITPGVTTIGEARFFLMETAVSIGMIPWFDATVWIRRKGHPHIEDDNDIIQKGDLLHCDFGVEYLGLCSDVQEMAYVKDEDDDQLISEYEHIHKQCQLLQDVLTNEFVANKTGNEILKSALDRAKKENIKGAMIYTHPIGNYGHGPGPTIGSFANQVHVEGLGEYPLHENTFYALELCVRQEVPSLDNMTILYGQEIDILFKDNKTHYVAGRQDNLHII